MLVYKAQQVVSASEFTIGKEWEMEDEKTPGKTRSGVSNYCDLMVLGAHGGMATIRLKGTDAEQVKKKVSLYTLGKPAEIPVKTIKSTQRGVMILEG